MPPPSFSLLGSFFFLLLVGPTRAFTAPPRPRRGRWLLAAVTTGRPVAAPATAPAPPPSLPSSLPPAVIVSDKKRGKGAAGAGDSGGGGLSNGQVTAQLMRLTTAADILSLVAGQGGPAALSVHNLVTALQRLAKVTPTTRRTGSPPPAGKGLDQDPRLAALIEALRPHLPTLSPEQLSAFLHALGRLGCIAPLLLLRRSRSNDSNGKKASSLLQELGGAVASKVGRFDARCLSTAIHGTARLLLLLSASQSPEEQEQEQQQSQQEEEQGQGRVLLLLLSSSQPQQEHQQQEQQEGHALALFSLLVDAMTQRMMQEALLVVAGAPVIDKGGSQQQQQQQQQQQRSHGASSGGIDTGAKGGKHRSHSIEKGSKRQRRNNGGIGVSPQDVAMALSSVARAAGGVEGQYRPPDAFLAAAVQLIPHQLPAYSPSDLATLITGLARLLPSPASSSPPPSPIPPALVFALARAVVLKLDGFRHAWELAAVVEGLHALGVSPQPGMLVALRRQKRGQHAPPSHSTTTTTHTNTHTPNNDDGHDHEQDQQAEINRLITACASFDAPGLLAIAEEHLQELSPVNVATLLNRLARTRLKAPEERRALLQDRRFKALMRRLPALLPGMEPRALANTVHALAKLRYQADPALLHAVGTIMSRHAPVFNPTELAMALQGLSRLLSLTPSSSHPFTTTTTTSSSSSSNRNPTSASPLLPPTLLPRLATALLKIVRKPLKGQKRADEGLLGSPHLALTIGSLPRLAREPHEGGMTSDVLCSPAFVALLLARVGERVDRMQAWERKLVGEGLQGLGWKDGDGFGTM